MNLKKFFTVAAMASVAIVTSGCPERQAYEAGVRMAAAEEQIDLCDVRFGYRGQEPERTENAELTFLGRYMVSQRRVSACREGYNEYTKRSAAQRDPYAMGIELFNNGIDISSCGSRSVCEQSHPRDTSISYEDRRVIDRGRSTMIEACVARSEDCRRGYRAARNVADSDRGYQYRR
jgi:hypothetical protein